MLGDLDAPRVRRDDRRIVERQAVAHVVEQNRHGGQVVDRTVEEALLLGRVQVDGHHAVGAGCPHEREHELGGDGFAAEMLLVLPRIAEERGDDGDRACRRAFGGIDHDELFHDPLVDRLGMRLHDEHVRAADRLRVAHVHLAVREVVGRRRKHLGAEVVGGLGGLLRVSTTRHQSQAFIGGAFKNSRHHSPFTLLANTKMEHPPI